MTKEQLIVIGKIIERCRALTGGINLNGFRVRASSIEQASIILPALRNLVEEYDRLTIEELTK